MNNKLKLILGMSIFIVILIGSYLYFGVPNIDGSLPICEISPVIQCKSFYISNNEDSKIIFFNENNNNLFLKFLNDSCSNNSTLIVSSGEENFLSLNNNCCQIKKDWVICDIPLSYRFENEEIVSEKYLHIEGVLNQKYD